MELFTKAFWQLTLVKVIRTFAQSLGAALAANYTDLISADWIGVLSLAGMAALLCLLWNVSRADNDVSRTEVAAKLGEKSIAETTERAVEVAKDEAEVA